MPGCRPSSSRLRRQARALCTIGLVAALSLFAACRDKTADERPDNWSGPWIEVDESVHDFGPLYSTETRRHVFRLRNRGGETLVIHRVKKDCGCAKPSLDRHEIPPGETAELTLDFTPPFIGALEKRIWIFNNDPYAKTTILKLRAQGRGLAYLEPSVVKVSGTLPAEGLTRDLVMTAADSQVLSDVRFESSSPYIRIEALGVDRGARLKFRLHIDGFSEAQVFRESIPVRFRLGATGPAKSLLVPFQVLGKLEPEGRVAPSAIFVSGSAGASRSAEIRFEAPSGVETRPQVTILGEQAFRLVEQEGAGDGRLEIEVEIPPRGARVAATCVLDWGDAGRRRIPMQAWAEEG